VDIANPTSQAGLVGNITVTATSPATLNSQEHADSKATADGSATASTSLGIGAGVAITLTNLNNHTLLPAGSTLNASTLDAEATTTTGKTNTLDAEASSGSGGGKVSLAGSLALVIGNLHTDALIVGTVNLSGDATLVAGSNSSSTAKAEPDGVGATSSSFGFSAAVALNLITENTSAGIADNGVLVGAHVLNITATTNNAMTTEAKMGAAGGSVDITPSVAVSLSNLTTSASIGTGADTTIAGDLTANATQTASVTSHAGAKSSGATSAGIGIAVAITVANHLVQATMARNVSGIAALTLLSSGDSTSAATSQASAGGAPAAGSAGAPTGGVDGAVSGERSNADGQAAASGGSGSGTTGTPSAKTSGGKVSAAASVSVDIANPTSQAGLVGNITVTATSPATLGSQEHAEPEATADGSATAATSLGIGAGVAINLTNLNNHTLLPAGSILNASHLDAEATTPMGHTNTPDEEASSGSGGGKVSLAGSLALVIANLHTDAQISGTVNLTGDAKLVAGSNSSSTAKAEPDGV